MKILRNIFFALIFLVFSFSGFSEIKFDNLNLNEKDELLFSVSRIIPGEKNYSTLFLQKISAEKKSAKILTCFADKIESINNGAKILISNSYGNAIYDFEKKSLEWISDFKMNFEKNNLQVQSSLSPDGKWFCFLEKIGTSKAKLILQNVENLSTYELDNEANFSFNGVPVIWSEDGENLIYQKNNFLYFCNLNNLKNGIQIEEKFRRIGKGKIDCVQWVNKNAFAYVDFDIVYLINAKEFSSLGIYSNIFSIGKVVGRLPFVFEPDNCSFMMNKSGTEILVVRNNSTFYYYKMNKEENSDYLKLVASKSYDNFLDGTYKTQIFWKENYKPILWTDFISVNGKKSCSAYSFNAKNEIVKLSSINTDNADKLGDDSDFNVALSPDGKYFATSIGENVVIYKVEGLSEVAKINVQDVSSLCFRNKNELCIGDDESVKIYNIVLENLTEIFLTSAKNVLWTKNYNDLIYKTEKSKNYFKYNFALNTWEKIQNKNLFENSTEILPAQVQNKNYRVYKATSKNEKFANGIYVRNLSEKTNTFALYKEVLQKNQKSKKIALVFDLTNNANGVNEIIALAEKYDLKISYFINGEFIRRYPAEVRKIALSGAEVGSLFYSNINLTNSEFEVTSDFIKRGLARNEDEYFECTGKELSLFWHAPYYKSSALIRDAGSEAGYSYIDFPTDQEFFESKGGKVLESQIIPISVGLSSESQKKNFYSKLELLINSLIEANYKIVPVSEL